MGALLQNPAKYPLGATRHATVRLTLQYYLIEREFNDTLLDPAIDYQRPNLKIADIACGTAIWLNHIKPHSSSGLHAFDVDLSNLPPPQWTDSIHRHRYNIFDEPKAELEEAFDIVHVQLVVGFVDQTNFPKVATNLMKLLKSGGWIQWTEFIASQYTIERPEPNMQTPHLDKVLPTLWIAFGRDLSAMNWPLNFRTFFESEGFKVTSHITPSADRRQLPEWTQILFMSFEEMLAFLSSRMDTSPDATDKTEELTSLVANAYSEFIETGSCVHVPRTRVVAQKGTP